MKDMDTTFNLISNEIIKKQIHYHKMLLKHALDFIFVFLCEQINLQHLLY